MSEATARFDEWTNQYWTFQGMVESRPEEREEAAAMYASFLELLRPILNDLCVDAESVGIDSSPLIEVQGVFNRLVESPDLFDSAMDEVWSTAKRIEMKERARAGDPWVPVREADCTYGRSTLGRHARSDAHPHIRKGAERGVFEVRKSHLKGYLSPEHWGKFGAEM